MTLFLRRFTTVRCLRAVYLFVLHVHFQSSHFWFDIINSKPARRVVFKLYDDVVPKTTRNFRELATGQHGFGYAGSSFHRVIPQIATSLMATGGKSIYGAKFPGAFTKTFVLKHNKPRLLSMANAGKKSPMFFITTVTTSWGIVVKAVEAEGYPSRKTKSKVTITSSGTV
ncbi:hypothetical protein K435DRAFT_822905 [Dendrothele bispora CBS 962.96]|uniref:Peptidyl-prolyl cis-trans isomerase n=1 Tax=Dendrothele bispora (strain CBS 962.96) TaxID=1314807 RepID=A0A4S8L5U6_DENBC|nr:hypothetical protein K435DRAFT_822905 [Dendrothele bispora CBS 962.96]